MSWGGRSAVRLTQLTIETYGAACHLHAHGLCLVGTPAIRLDLPPRHPDGPSADHLIPRSRGGTDDLDNLRPAHRRCNSGRRDDALPSRPRVADGRAFFK